MTKVVNKGDKDYYFQYDGGTYGPIRPGEAADFPPMVSDHACKKSWVLDDEGNVDHQTVVPAISLTAEELKATLRYPCPMSGINCMAGPFKTIDELREHLEVHLTGDPLEGAGALDYALSKSPGHAARK